MDKLVYNSRVDEKKVFFEVFSIIGEEVLGPCFDHALYLAASNQDTLMASNYLKSDVNYYKDVLKKLWYIYNKKKSALKDAIEELCKVVN